MATDLNELASAVFGTHSVEQGADAGGGQTTTMYGTAMLDSADGRVPVVLGGNVIAPDGGDTSVNLATTVSVRAGDSVIVTLIGGDTGKHPVVTGVVGRGDEEHEELLGVGDLADAANTLAGEANDAAEATGQHFFDDANGIHVTTSESDATRGPNILANSSGVLVRDGTTTMTSMTRSGFGVYDPTNGQVLNAINGSGNVLYDKDGHVIASYGQDIRLLPDPVGSNARARIYIAGDNVFNAGMIEGEYRVGDDDGSLTVKGSRSLSLSGSQSTTISARDTGGSVAVGFGGAQINSSTTLKGIWAGSDVIWLDSPMKVFMSQARFIQITGSPSGSNFVMFATNGDWNAANIGLTLAFQNGAVVVYAYGWNNATNVRVNWMIVQF